MYKANIDGLEKFLKDYLEGENTNCKIWDVSLSRLSSTLTILNCHFDEDTYNEYEGEVQAEFNFTWDRYILEGNIYNGNFFINKLMK